MSANNTVSLRLALEGADAAASGLDKVKNSMASMAASFTVGNLASKALETGMAKVGLAIDYVMESAKMAARFETLGVVMQTVGRNAGYTGQQMMDAAKGVQMLGITMLEARESVTKMASAHIDLANAQGLARVAQDAAVIGGINSSEAFKAMIYGIQSGQTEVLRTIGINVSFEASYRTLAKELGTTAEALTEAEKTTARTNVVMAAGRDIAGAYEDAMGTAGKQMTSLARYSEDAKVKLGAVFNDTLLLAVSAYTDNLKDSNGELDKLAANRDIEDWSASMAQSFAFVADSAKNTGAVIATVADTIYTALAQANAFASFRGGDAFAAGDAWQARMNDRFDPAKQFQARLEALQAKRQLDARSINNTAYSGGNNPSSAGPATIVFDTPEQKAQYKDRIAALDKSNQDAKSSLDNFHSATEAIMRKGLTTEMKIAAERRQYLAKLPAGVSVDSDEVKQALRQIEINARKGKATGDAAKQDFYAAEAARLYSSTMDALAKAQESASAKADDLSKAQEALRVVQASPHWAQYNRQMQEQIIYAASLTQAEEDRGAAKKLLLKAQTDQNASDQKAAEALHAEISGLRDSNAAMELHNQEIGLNAEALNALTLKRLDDQITVQAGIVLDGERLVADGYVIASLQEQINKLDELKKKRGLLATGQTATLAADESKKAQEEWKKTSEAIENNLTDALMRGFESGKGFAVNLRDTVVNMFKTMVLRPVISAVMNPVSAVAAGFMGTAGTAAAGGVAGSAGTGFLGGLSATAGGWGTGFANGLSAWGAEGSVSGMMANASLYSTAEIVGALAPIGLGIMALVAISKATAGEMRSGQQYAYNPATGLAISQGPSGGPINDKEVSAAISGTIESINRLLGSYGSASRLSGFVAGLESSGDNRGGVMAGGTLTTGGVFGQSGGGSVYDGTKFDPSKSFNMTAQEAATALALELQQSVIEAMQKSDLPDYLAKVFSGLSANTMTADQITNTLAFASGLKQVREALLETREPLQILKDNVATGFATLATSATTFKTDFVAAIDAGVSPANLAAWQSLGATMDQLAASTKDANDALIASQDQLAAKVLSAQTALNSAQAGVASALRSISDNVLALADAAKQSSAGVADARNAISQGYWDAQDAMKAAQEKVNDLNQKAADKLKDFGKTITDFLADINPATSSTASLQSLKAQLSATSVLAGGGDEGAQGKLLAQAKMVLTAGQASSTSRVDYARTEAFVRQTLEGVQKAITPIASAATAPIITPMESALTELRAAQLRVIEFAAVAAVTGANTDRSTAATAMSSQGLWDSFKAAQTVNDAAQTAYATALTLTAGLALTQTGTLNGLVTSLSGLGRANTDLTTAQDALTAAQNAANVTVTAADGAFALTTTGANLLTTALGLTGTAASDLKTALVNPATAASTLATVLGGLSDVQLAAFGTALGTSPITTFTGSLTTTQINLFKGALTTSELLTFTGALTSASTTIGTGAAGVFLGVNGVLTTGAGAVFTGANGVITTGANGAFTGANGAILNGANGVFTSANGQVLTAVNGVFTGVNGTLLADATGTFTGVNGTVVTASNGVFTGVNGTIVGLSSGLFTGVNGTISTAAGGVFTGVNNTVLTGAGSVFSGVNTALTGAASGVFTGVNTAVYTDAGLVFTGVNGAVLTGAGGAFFNVNETVVTNAGGVFDGVNTAIVAESGNTFDDVNATVLTGASGVFGDVGDTLTTGAAGTFADVNSTVLTGAGSAFSDVNAALLVDADTIFTGANTAIVDDATEAFDSVNSTLLDSAGGAFATVNDTLATDAGAAFTDVNASVLTGAGGVFTDVNGVLTGVTGAGGAFDGVNTALSTAAGGAFAGINTTLSTAATTISNVLTGLLTPEQALTFQTTLSNSGLSADALATALGLTDGAAGAATAFSGILATTGTDATTLAGYLGQAGDAADAFAQLVGNLHIEIPAVTSTPAVAAPTYAGAGLGAGSTYTLADAQAAYNAVIAEGYSPADAVIGLQKYLTPADALRAAHDLHIPGYAVGTNSVPYDMTARVHAGEEITPRPYVDRQAQERAETNRLLAALLKSNAELKAEVAALKKPMTDTASATERSKDIAEQVAIGGLSNQTRIVTA